MKLTPLIYCAAAVFCSAANAASDTSLYAEGPPADASFVRFVGVEPGETTRFAGKAFSITTENDMAYIPVSSTLLDDIAAGTFVTVAHTSRKGALPIIEAPRTNAARVHLFLINASDQVLELRLADGSTPVIEAVDGASAGGRAVNPVAIALGVFEQGHTTALATFDVVLKRGQNVSFIADGTTVHMVENRFGPVAR